MRASRLLLPLLALQLGLVGHVRAAVESEQPTPVSLHDYFFAAARSGEVSVLKEFMKAGFPVDARNDQSYTALMIAAYQGQPEAVRVLIEGGAAPDWCAV